MKESDGQGSQPPSRGHAQAFRQYRRRRDVQGSDFIFPPWKIDRPTPCHGLTPVFSDQIHPFITNMVNRTDHIPA